MELVEIRPLDDCLDGGLQYSYAFDGAVSERLVRNLAAGARLVFHADFPRPFYRIVFDSGVQVKGVAGDWDMLVVVPAGAEAGAGPGFEERLRAIIRPERQPAEPETGQPGAGPVRGRRQGSGPDEGGF